jgi:hypothetical protein
MTHPNVAKKTTTAWIIGCISYADQFDLPYHTKFVFRLYGPRGRPIAFDPTPNTTINGRWAAFTGSITATKEKAHGHQKK